MAYINPVELFKDQLARPVLKSSIEMLPHYMANKREQERLAQQKEQWQSQEPYRQELLQQEQFKNRQNRELEKAYNLMHGLAPAELQAGEEEISKGSTGITQPPQMQSPQDAFGKAVVNEYMNIKMPITTQPKIHKQNWYDPNTQNYYEQDMAFDPEINNWIPQGEPRIVKTNKPIATKYKDIPYWDASGKAYKMNVPIEEYNNKVQELQNQGYLFSNPKSGANKLQSPSQQMTNLKLKIWEKYLRNDPNDPITERDAAMIGLQDPYIKQAMGIVQLNPDFFSMSPQEQLLKLEQTANTLRQAAKKATGATGLQPKVPGGEQRRLNPIGNAPVAPRTVQPQQPTAKLPPGLNELTIQYNMQKHGKTREEVIQKYRMITGQ